MHVLELILPLLREQFWILWAVEPMVTVFPRKTRWIQVLCVELVIAEFQKLHIFCIIENCAQNSQEKCNETKAKHCVIRVKPRCQVISTWAPKLKRSWSWYYCQPLYFFMDIRNQIVLMFLRTNAKIRSWKKKEVKKALSAYMNSQVGVVTSASIATATSCVWASSASLPSAVVSGTALADVVSSWVSVVAVKTLGNAVISVPTWTSVVASRIEVLDWKMLNLMMSAEQCQFPPPIPTRVSRERYGNSARLHQAAVLFVALISPLNHLSETGAPTVKSH